MYTTTNFKTKKQLKEAVAAGQKLTVFSPGPFGCPTEGTVCIEGPHFPEIHRFYAQVELKDGIIIKVK